MSHNSTPMRTVRRSASLAAALLLLSLGAPGVVNGQSGTPAATAAVNDPTTMTVAVESAPSDLDPASSYDENSDIPLRAAYEGLVTLKGASLTDVVPVLAQSIDDQNAQHQVYTFKLQPNVKFHDGTAFDAAAAKFGLQRTITLNFGPGPILGTFFANAQGADQSDKLIQVVDATTLRIAFTRPQPFFLIALAASYGTGFVSPTAVKQHTANDSSGKPDNAHVWLQTHEAGTGPYQLVGEMTGSAPIVMQQFPGYWRGWTGNHLSRIVIETLLESGVRRQGLEAGTIDAATVLLPQDILRLQKENGYQFNLDAKNTLRVDFLAMAAGYGQLQDKRARQAMAYAFDYAAYNKGELGGLGSQPNSPFPGTLLGFDSSIQPFHTDLKMALQLLTQAGVKAGTTFTYAAQQGRGDIAGAILKQQLEQLGYNLTIKKYSSDDYNNTVLPGAIASDRPDFFVQTWWPDYNSPLNFAFPLFYSKSTGAAGQNAGYYTDLQVDQIIEKAQQTSDQTQLIASFKQVQQIVYHDDPAGIFMAQSPERTAVSGHVQGQIFNALYLGTFDFYALSKN